MFLFFFLPQFLATNDSQSTAISLSLSPPPPAFDPGLFPSVNLWKMMMVVAQHDGRGTTERRQSEIPGAANETTLSTLQRLLAWCLPLAPSLLFISCKRIGIF